MELLDSLGQALVLTLEQLGLALELADLRAVGMPEVPAPLLAGALSLSLAQRGLRALTAPASVVAREGIPSIPIAYVSPRTSSSLPVPPLAPLTWAQTIRPSAPDCTMSRAARQSIGI